MITVVDYGLGNLRSMCAALERLEIPFRCTPDATAIKDATGLILPGVGAFPDGMQNLRQHGLVDVLHELVLEDRRPVLGICLGFQLMATEGHEFGREAGLGWIDGRVVRMAPSEATARVPHVGWNDCVRIKESPLFHDVAENALFYFTHSYHMECFDDADVTAVSDHSQRFVAAVRKQNIFGTQFHPEKSQSQGLTVLRNFANKVVAGC